MTDQRPALQNGMTAPQLRALTALANYGRPMSPADIGQRMDPHDGRTVPGQRSRARPDRRDDGTSDDQEGLGGDSVVLAAYLHDHQCRPRCAADAWMTSVACVGQGSLF